MFNVFVDGIARRDVKEVKEFIGATVAEVQKWLQLHEEANKEVVRGFESIETTLLVQQESIRTLNSHLALVKDSLAVTEAEVLKLQQKLNNTED